MLDQIASSLFSGEAPAPVVRHHDAARRTMFARLFGLLAAAALASAVLAACTTSGPSTGADATGTVGSAPSTTMTQATPAPTAAPTPTPVPTPTPLGPPAAPANLKSWWTFESGDGAGGHMLEHFSWSRPPGQVDGYYLESVWYIPEDDPVPTPSPCRSDWQRLPASVTTYQDSLQNGAYRVFLCAFNEAGTSATVVIPEPIEPE